MLNVINWQYTYIFKRQFSTSSNIFFRIWNNCYKTILNHQVHSNCYKLSNMNILVLRHTFYEIVIISFKEKLLIKEEILLTFIRKLFYDWLQYVSLLFSDDRLFNLIGFDILKNISVNVCFLVIKLEIKEIVI